MPSPIVDWIAPMSGEWIIPAINGIWDASTQIRVAHEDDGERREISGEVVTVPSRESKVVVQGATHNLDGVIQGKLRAYGGISALSFLTRLHDLISNQHRYTIIVVKRNLYVRNARFHTDYDWKRERGTDMWNVTLHYSELS